MSDYAPVSLIIVEASTPAAVAAAFRAVDEYGLSDTPWSVESMYPDEIILGDAYGDDQAGLCAASDISQALQDVEGLSFSVYQEAKYEYDGEGMIRVAGVGTFTHSGGNSGEALISVGEIEKILAEDAFSYELRSKLTKLIGKDVRDAYQARLEALPVNSDERTINRPQDEGDDDNAE